jgi:pimeloyl-ACP methyl ester carboxylesterase
MKIYGIICLMLGMLLFLSAGCDMLPTEISSALPASPAVSSTTKPPPKPTTTVPAKRLLKLDYSEFNCGENGPENNKTIPDTTWDVGPGEAKFISQTAGINNNGHGVSYFMNWTEPPEQFMEGDTITLTASVQGQIDIKREKLLFYEASFEPVWGWSLDWQKIGPIVKMGPPDNPALETRKAEYSLEIPIEAIKLTGYIGPEDVVFTIRYRIYLPFMIGSYDFHYRYVPLDQTPVKTTTTEEPTSLTPLVFIPGVTGSQFAGSDGHILWPPEGPGASRGPTNKSAISNDFSRLSLNPATGPHEDIKAIDVIRTDGGDMYYGPLLYYLTSEGGYVEYKVNNDPKRRTAAGFDMSQKDRKPTLFVFAYDWRLSNADNARVLADYIAGINKLYPNKKVDIVAHSMGGLIARRFIIDNPGKVKRLITIATPFLGSAKPLYQMIYGTTGTGFMDDVTWALFNSELKDMLAYYPGIHELMATRSYFALGGRPYAMFNATDLSASFADYIPLMGPEGIVDNYFNDPSYNGMTPAQSNNAFHSYTGNGNSQDDWSNDTTGVKYYHIIGVQSSGNTPLTLQENNTLKSPREWRFTKFGPGDGTVPVLSAERIGEDGRNLNANGTTIIFAEGSDDLLEHTGLVTNPEVQRKVLEILNSK